jgi:hypothetical protein
VVAGEGWARVREEEGRCRPVGHGGDTGTLRNFHIAKARTDTWRVAFPISTSRVCFRAHVLAHTCITERDFQ